MGQFVGRIICLVLLFCSALKIMGQSQDKLINTINQNILEGDYKASRSNCLYFMNQYGQKTDVPTLNIVRLELAFSNIHLGYKDEGLRLLHQAEKEMDKFIEMESIKKSEEYAQWLNMLSNTYLLIDSKKSLALLEKQIDILDDLDLHKTRGYVLALLQICGIYNSMHDNVTFAVDQILARLLPLAKEVCGNQSTEYCMTLLTAIKNAENKGNVTDPIQYSDEFFRVANSGIKENPYIKSFIYHSRLRALLDSNQKEKALSEAKYFSSYIKNDCMARYTTMTSDERVATMGYIQDWFFDGLSRLSKSYPVTESASITYDGSLFAKGLMQNLEFIEDGTKKKSDLSIDWRKVRNALKPGEAAIEFIAYFKPGFLPMHHYLALVLKHGYDSPHIIKANVISFLDEEELDDIDYMRKKCLSLWEPLLPELRGISTIYISPYGHIHNLPIESFLPEQLSGTKVLRLSSTRQLVLKNKNVGNGAVIYGGLEYNMSLSDMVKARRFRGAVSELHFLEGTFNEAKIISEIINSSRNPNLKATTYLEKEGTETSFKLLSGKGKRIIHLATHGFYYNKPQNESIDYFQKAMGINCTLEDRPLTRSGLFMAGAQNSYNNGDIPQGVDDGVLTAQEISEIDLRGLDLVALSACQTAKGDILGDGVFGLQRGFKKAGAKSILMSLWKVDDEATCLLMTEFYSKWIGLGKTKHDALEEAKKSIRSHKEKGWDDPKYWAAFILLDGLN